MNTPESLFRELDEDPDYLTFDTAYSVATRAIELAQRYHLALHTILEMAERSDAHPDLKFAEVAREALGDAE